MPRAVPLGRNIMDVIEAIMTRRSIRRFTSESVSEEFLTQILHAAMAAPSSKNEQPWVFVILDDRALLNTIPTFHPYAKMMTQAPVAILVCADSRRFLSPEVWIQDCAAATQNMLLAAHGLNLGAVWLGVYPRTERMKGLRKLLHLPEFLIPFSLVALGHPAERKAPSNRFDLTRIYRNKIL